MSIHIDDLRNSCGLVGELAADEIEDMERAYALLFEENAKLKARLEHCQCPACIGGTLHASDCAVHNMPHEPNGSCNCGASRIAPATASAGVEAPREEFDQSMFLAAVRTLAEIDALLGLPADGCNDPDVTLSRLKDYAEHAAMYQALRENKGLEFVHAQNVPTLLLLRVNVEGCVVTNTQGAYDFPATLDAALKDEIAIQERNRAALSRADSQGGAA